MRDGFLFDGVDVAGYDFAVDVEPELSVGVSSDSTEPNLSLSNVAVSGAGRASNPATGELLVECCLFADSQGRHLNASRCLLERKSIWTVSHHGLAAASE